MTFDTIMSELGKTSLELSTLLEQSTVSLKEHEDVLDHVRRSNNLVVTYRQMANWYKENEYQQMVAAMKTNIELSDRLAVKIARKEERDDNY